MRISGYILLLLAFISSCNGGNKKQAEQDAAVRKISAERFSIYEKQGFRILEIRDPWQGSEGTVHRWFLVDRGHRIPEGADPAHVIFVPVKKIVCMSVTHVAMIAALGEDESIMGISGTGFVYSEKVREKIKSGHIREVGYEANLNNELILEMQPDLVMTYGIGGETAGYTGRLRELGIKVLFNADYLETDPLKKAEWIKLFGALYCRERMADSLFSDESERYNSLREFIVNKITMRPGVLLGLPYKDTWYVSPGNSYISTLISDAGGNYLWKDEKSSISMPMGLENVYMRALKADFWLNTGTATSKSDIEAMDNRFAHLPSFVNGNIFNNNGRLTEGGGNDYWEAGAVHPHLILNDIACILHPELFPGYRLQFYHKLQ